MVTIKLKELLNDHGMTQAELAKLTGIRPSTICDMCNGISQFIKLEHSKKFVIHLVAAYLNFCNWIDFDFIMIVNFS